ncbi:hypothetical protein LIER_37149 [Lithospermum erythrorhizon]|uniref:Uncharacterized protein n=1 Tax=Lithospermum erythrorhizon TaxID=34254 RepID=A0AAV3PG37_LITER
MDKVQGLFPPMMNGPSPSPDLPPISDIPWWAWLSPAQAPSTINYQLPLLLMPCLHAVFPPTTSPHTYQNASSINQSPEAYPLKQ